MFCTGCVRIRAELSKCHVLVNIIHIRKISKLNLGTYMYTHIFASE